MSFVQLARELEDAIAALKVCAESGGLSAGYEVILADQVRRLERVAELLDKQTVRPSDATVK
jgi:chaperonin GroEL (HSP60 family)